MTRNSPVAAMSFQILHSTSPTQDNDSLSCGQDITRIRYSMLTCVMAPNWELSRVNVL